MGRDTGISAVTIWSVMMGVRPEWTAVPADPADLGRCIRLLDAIPAWRNRLSEVALAYPEWGPLVGAWSELETLFREENTGPWPMAERTYAKLRELIG